MDKAFEQCLKLLTEQGMRQGKAVIISLLIIFATIIVVVLLTFLLYKLLRAISHKLFRILEKKQGHRIHIEFLERVTTFGLGLLLIVSLLGWKNLGGSLLGSAAVLTGVIGFAAQDVIKDVLSGLLISIYKPFDLGDRIELEDGTVGVVESITMRHVVIVRLDTLRMVIPNSKINAASILNYSFGYVRRSCIFRFPVGYDSDIEKTRKVISDAIKECPYSIPGKKQKDGTMDYGPVYFIELADSAFIMAVTVYFEPETASENLKNDINTRVVKALTENGIDIPYNHTSVILKNGD